MSLTRSGVASAAQSFIDLIDGKCEWPLYELADNAVMDWFGRTVRGRSAILDFFRTRLPHSRHTVKNVTEIPAIKHRLLETMKDKPVVVASFKAKLANNENTTVLVSVGSADGRHTPDNPIQMDCEALLRAPGPKHLSTTTLGATPVSDWLFLEILGRLEYELESSEGACILASKPLDRIVLGYSGNSIHFAAYEGPSVCRKKLNFA